MLKQDIVLLVMCEQLQDGHEEREGHFSAFLK